MCTTTAFEKSEVAFTHFIYPRIWHGWRVQQQVSLRVAVLASSHILVWSLFFPVKTMPLSGHRTLVKSVCWAKAADNELSSKSLAGFECEKLEDTWLQHLPGNNLQNGENTLIPLTVSLFGVAVTSHSPAASHSAANSLSSVASPPIFAPKPSFQFSPPSALLI
jgi:hypothetical protein